MGEKLSLNLGCTPSTSSEDLRRWVSQSHTGTAATWLSFSRDTGDWTDQIRSSERLALRNPVRAVFVRCHATDLVALVKVLDW